MVKVKLPDLQPETANERRARMTVGASFWELGRDTLRVPSVLSVQTPNQRSQAPTDTRWERAKGAPTCIATPPQGKHGIAWAGDQMGL